ncbi:MAG: flagellar hook assembly protein FlgD [Propionivibrio sp.]|uniref:flagellar hook assembly protein FlgD n=1 Tax=Propionivibrio sp. TaxID=2212460 RepID=UPI001A4368BB|nr:flagellar hook assembly protein FlgD [Propionivibrio sp.]MBL8413376.1 flagellar hook assembly protein FlgD [Propionivibrio sp.]
MSTVQATTSSSDPFAAINAATKSSSKASAPTAEDPQDRFLKLLVTQLKNQDPLNPMDNAQMTSQLAQMSTVSGIEKLNTTLNSLVDSFANSQSMQAAEMIGKRVLVAGSRLPLASGQAYGGINLSAAADQVKLSILDAAGQVIQTQDLGARDAGVFDFVWDGINDAGSKAPDGIYRFSVDARQGGNKVTADPLQIGTVSALVRSKSGFLLDLGALGTIDFKNVQQIL